MGLVQQYPSSIVYAWKGREDWIWTRCHFPFWGILGHDWLSSWPLGFRICYFSDLPKTLRACTQLVAGGETASKSWFVSLLRQTLSMVCVVYRFWPVCPGATQCFDIFPVTALWVYLGQAEGEGANKIGEFFTFHHIRFFETSLLQISSHSDFPNF